MLREIGLHSSTKTNYNIYGRACGVHVCKAFHSSSVVSYGAVRLGTVFPNSTAPYNTILRSTKLHRTAP